MRLKARTVDLLHEIAEEEDRSDAKMADILINIGIETYRARQKKEREPESTL